MVESWHSSLLDGNWKQKNSDEWRVASDEYEPSQRSKQPLTPGFAVPSPLGEGGYQLRPRGEPKCRSSSRLEADGGSDAQVSIQNPKSLLAHP